jgi:tetratricopeptide (TPR) repeat protein
MLRVSLPPWLCLAALSLVLGACAAKAPPALPSVPKYAEFMYPVVPPDLRSTEEADRVDRGWRFLQNDDLADAEREYAAALKRSPAFYPAATGKGYVALARQRYDEAVASFDAALKAAPTYVPALVGRGQSLLALKREGEALAAFEAALAVDSSLTDLARRVQVLRFRGLQDIIDAARTATAAGRTNDARAAYTRAIAASPDSAFLHRELGLLERKQGTAAAALEHFRTATELDPTDAVSFAQIGEILEQQQDVAGAEAAYRKASELDPTPDVTRRLAALREKMRALKLPPEYLAIAASTQITRGELAALLGIRLETVLRAAPAREVVMTDTRGHWAAPWITTVVRAGAMDEFQNHTFQPRAPVRRVDLAHAVSRVVGLLAASRPALRARIADRPEIADMDRGHLNYPDAAVAVASGVMPLLDGSQFQLTRPVSGAEATQAVERLLALAAQS